jgi:hypothetical protein
VPQTKDAPRLREAIEAYRGQHNEELNEDAQKLLARLAYSHEAAKAFEQLKPKDAEKDDDEAAIIRARQSAYTRAYLEDLKKGNPQLLRLLSSGWNRKTAIGQWTAKRRSLGHALTRRIWRALSHKG